MNPVRTIAILITTICVFLFATFIYHDKNQAYAACTGFENNCYACSCSTSGCNGTQLCYGTDDVTGQTCNVSQSCNTPTGTAFSCDCSGQVGNTFYTQVSCGDPSIVCSGELGNNGSGKTCHYCVSPLVLTGSPPQPTPSPTRYKTTSNTVTVPGTKSESATTQGGLPTRCSGIPISLGVEKKLLPLPNEGICSQTVTGACGRPGNCIIPKRIVIHVTGGGTSAESLYSYFASGSEYRGVGTQYVVDRAGKALQMTETLDTEIEVAYGVAYYVDHISIELVNDVVYKNKSESTPAQYQATLNLVRKLMAQYGIPKGNLEYDWRSNTDTFNSAAVPGIYGHYQLNPGSRADPGDGFLRDFRADL